MRDPGLAAARMTELDALTLARAQQREARALHALISLYQERVWALVSRMLVRHRHLVADVTQEVFLKVIDHLGRFDPRGPARLSTWILTIAVRTCLDTQKKWDRSSSRGEDVALSASVDPEALAAQRQLGRRVERAMAQLSADHRALLVLRAYHDLDYRELAHALELEEGTVKSRLNRARESLRALLGDHHD